MGVSAIGVLSLRYWEENAPPRRWYLSNEPCVPVGWLLCGQVRRGRALYRCLMDRCFDGAVTEGGTVLLDFFDVCDLMTKVYADLSKISTNNLPA